MVHCMTWLLKFLSDFTAEYMITATNLMFIIMIFYFDDWTPQLTVPADKVNYGVRWVYFCFKFLVKYEATYKTLAIKVIYYFVSKMKLYF